MINDFSEYEKFSSYSVKGYRACPICDENTSYEQLKLGRKTMYLWHCWFLNQGHSYCRLKKASNGHKKYDICPIPLIGVKIYER